MTAFSFYVQLQNLTYVEIVADKSGITLGIADIRHVPSSVRLTLDETVGLLGALDDMRASIGHDTLDAFAFDLCPEAGGACALRHIGVPDRTTIAVRTSERGTIRAELADDFAIDEVIKALLSAAKTHLTLRYSPKTRDLD